MPPLPPATRALLAPFAPPCSRRVWRHALVVLVGALLAPPRRTIAAARRAAGHAHARQFGRFHRVLSRARWSDLAVARTLLGLLVAAFVPTGPLVVGIDETIERRRGAKIAAHGSYRDPVRSSHGYFVKVSGLRWANGLTTTDKPGSLRRSTTRRRGCQTTGRVVRRGRSHTSGTTVMCAENLAKSVVLCVSRRVMPCACIVATTFASWICLPSTEIVSTSRSNRWMTVAFSSIIRN